MPSSMSFEFEGAGRESCNELMAATTSAYKIWQALCTLHNENQEEFASTFHVNEQSFITF